MHSALDYFFTFTFPSHSHLTALHDHATNRRSRICIALISLFQIDLVWRWTVFHFLFLDANFHHTSLDRAVSVPYLLCWVFGLCCVVWWIGRVEIGDGGY